MKRNVLCISTTPMDSHGNFNFGIACSDTYAQLKNADTVIVEVNPRLPYILGGEAEYVNIRDVDYIIESDEPILVLPPAPEATEVEKRIAQNIMPLIPNHACLQLGIGGVPNTIGSLIAESDLKDLGVNSEMFSDSMVDLYEAGKITNKYKVRDKGRSTFTFCFGNQRTYDFLHLNPQVAAYHCEYTNNPKYIGMEENVVSINAIIEIDLLSQVCSESMGLKQISGTGGALDFHIGAFESRGGKGILAFESTYQDKEDKHYSRIKPFLTPGGIVTIPRTCVHYVVTEHGVVNMKGRSIWGRAESLIGLADPMFREELLKSAAEMGVWTRTNRIPY